MPNLASSTRQWNQRSASFRLYPDLITILGGHDRLGRLLADLLDDRVVAFREQRRDVGFHRVGVRCASIFAAILLRRVYHSCSIDRLRVLEYRFDRLPRAVLEPLEKTARAGRYDMRCLRPVPRSEESRRCRSRAGSRVHAARDRTARPFATACAASATNSAPAASRPSAPARRGSSTRASIPGR